MLLDPGTLDLLPRGPEVVSRAADRRVMTELPASQVELATKPAAKVAEALAELGDLRRLLAGAAEGIGLVAAAGVHPFAAPEGEINTTGHYADLGRTYAGIARRQLVCGLHVHVAIRPIERALAVHNQLRSYLPELAALAGNGPFYSGRDSGLESIRPVISGQLPRQGVPPAFASPEEAEEALRWSLAAGAITRPGHWWWELRLHPTLGTVEVRVCDAQPTLERTGCLAALVQCLAVRLAELYDRRELPAPAPSWRIDQNRWFACRYGLHGQLADLDTGEPSPARDRIHRLLGTLAPTAERLGCAAELDRARSYLHHPLPAGYRALESETGMQGLVKWMVGAFLE